MQEKKRTYIAIDLKSFYASVECIERGLDPMTTNLVVADASRTQKTICLAVSPSLKAYGISGRARLFEVIQKVKEINEQRIIRTPEWELIGESYDDLELKKNPSLALTYIAAPPRMAYYMEYSIQIYHVYLKYIAPEDIHVYSIDEVFMDVTGYLNTYHLTARELAAKIIQDVLDTTGIPAAAGIGTNLYLCKVAMDIVAKHIPADANGMRIAQLDEMTYRRYLWNHRPLTDFWRVGKGIARKLEDNGIYTMGDVARCSLNHQEGFHNEALLYQLFGINAELLIDHAWGYEPCTMAEIKAYKPVSNSLGSGQVLHSPYSYEKAKLIVQEMADQLALDLVDKQFVTNQIVLTIGYDIENLTNPHIRSSYKGEITIDYYGRKVPKHAHGTTRLERWTSSSKQITEAAIKLYERIVNKNLLVRRVNITACSLMNEQEAIRKKKDSFDQIDLFTNYEEVVKQEIKEEQELTREKNLQKTILNIKKKYGKNSVLKGMNLEEGSTAKDRNKQIGGHKA